MSVHVVVIPADEAQPVEVMAVPGPDLGYGLARLLDGSWEIAATIEDTGALLVDVCAAENGRPANPRAAAVAAAFDPGHSPVLRGTVLVVGTSWDGDLVDPYAEDLDTIGETLGMVLAI